MTGTFRMLIARLLALDPEDANEMELPNCTGDAPSTVGTSMPALLTVRVQSWRWSGSI